MTSLIRFSPPFIINFNGGPTECFFLYNSLNPVMFPCLAFSGGNCQDAVILVDVLATTVKPLGACEGTERVKFILLKQRLFFNFHINFSKDFLKDMKIH